MPEALVVDEQESAARKGAASTTGRTMDLPAKAEADPLQLASACSRLVSNQLGAFALVVCVIAGLMAEVRVPVVLLRAVGLALAAALLGRGLGWVCGWILAGALTRRTSEATERDA